MVTYGSTIRTVTLTTSSGGTVTLDFSTDGIILIKDPAVAPTIAFTNYAPGKRCTVIVQNSSNSSLVITTGLPGEQVVLGDVTVTIRGRQTTFLEYVSVTSDINGTYLSDNWA